MSRTLMGIMAITIAVIMVTGLVHMNRQDRRIDRLELMVANSIGVAEGLTTASEGHLKPLTFFDVRDVDGIRCYAFFNERSGTGNYFRATAELDRFATEAKLTRNDSVLFTGGIPSNETSWSLLNRVPVSGRAVYSMSDFLHPWTKVIAE